MKLSQDFYVYQYIRLDTNTVFYVGKGIGKRAKKMWHHNEYCQRIAYKYGYRIEYIIMNLTEAEAFIKESEYIKKYKSQGLCEANFTDGGEGTVGCVHSYESREQCAISHGGRPFEVYTVDGKFVGVWKSQMQCSRDLNVRNESLHTILHKGKNCKSTKGYIFRFLDDERTLEKQLATLTKEEEFRRRSNSKKGLIRSKKTRELMSKLMKGKFVGAGHSCAKKVIDTETGKIWGCAGDAAKELNVVKSTFWGWLNGSYPNKTSLMYLEDYLKLSQQDK